MKSKGVACLEGSGQEDTARPCFPVKHETGIRSSGLRLREEQESVWHRYVCRGRCFMLIFYATVFDRC